MGGPVGGAEGDEGGDEVGVVKGGAVDDGSSLLNLNFWFFYVFDG